jgi:hypothetical protein
VKGPDRKLRNESCRQVSPFGGAACSLGKLRPMTNLRGSSSGLSGAKVYMTGAENITTIPVALNFLILDSRVDNSSWVHSEICTNPS